MSIITANHARIIQGLFHARGVNVPKPQENTPRQIYETMEQFYYSNGLYNGLQEQLENTYVAKPALMQELRNPAHQVIEFYAKKLWPGSVDEAFQVVTDNDQIVEPIAQIFTWSNWRTKKQMAARWFPMHGDLFLKVEVNTNRDGRADSVYIRPVNAKYVTSFTVDHRGYIEALAYEVREDTDNTGRDIWRSEFWDLDGVRIYRHGDGPNQEEADLGDPVESVTLDEMGIDFVPFAHAPFIDLGTDEDGNSRGMPRIWPALTQIADLDRKATRLSSLLYRHGKPTGAIMANDKDKEGRPLPPPRMRDSTTGTKLAMTALQSVKRRLAEAGSERGFEDDDVIELPGFSKYEWLIANINWQAHLDEIKACQEAIAEKLPELHYYRIFEKSDMSGRALRLLLGPAIEVALEARHNGFAAIARAVEMALHFGKRHELFPETIGKFNDGDFEHTYFGPEIVALSEEEKLQLVVQAIGAGMDPADALENYGGYSHDEAAELAGRWAKSSAPAVPGTGATPAVPGEETDPADIVKREQAIEQSGQRLEASLTQTGLTPPARQPAAREIANLLAAARAAAQS